MVKHLAVHVKQVHTADIKQSFECPECKKVPPTEQDLAKIVFE